MNPWEMLFLGNRNRQGFTDTVHAIGNE